MIDRPNLLFVTHRLPYPPDKGDRIRTWNWLRYLAERSNVYLASLADEPIRPATMDILQECCKEVAVASIGGKKRLLRAVTGTLKGKSISEGMFASNSLQEQLAKWLNEISFTAAIASASSVAHYIHRPELAQARKIVDLVDVDSQKWRDYRDASTWPKKWVFSLEAKRIDQLERSIGTWADAVCVVSSPEARLLAGKICAEKLHVITNGVDLDFFQPSDDCFETSGCVFLGAMDYKPNVDGVCWFAKHVWPEVLKRHPEARFRIVGRNPAPAVQQLDVQPGIDVIGPVDDVRPSVASAKVVVAPLLIARGLQNKILEAMALGKPVLSSPAALSGFSSRDDLPAIAAPTITDWVEQLDRCFVQDALCAELAEKGRRYAERYHAWESCLEPLGEWLALGVPTPIPNLESSLIYTP